MELDNYGTVTVNGVQPLTMNRGNAAHVNRASGVMDGGDVALTQSGTPASFSNSGTLTVGTGKTWTVSGGTFDQGAGSLGGGGKLVLSSVPAGSFGTTFTLGTLEVNGSTVTFGTGFTLGTLIPADQVGHVRRQLLDLGNRDEFLWVLRWLKKPKNCEPILFARNVLLSAGERTSLLAAVGALSPAASAKFGFPGARLTCLYMAAGIP